MVTIDYILKSGSTALVHGVLVYTGAIGAVAGVGLMAIGGYFAKPHDGWSSFATLAKIGGTCLTFGSAVLLAESLFSVFAKQGISVPARL